GRGPESAGSLRDFHAPGGAHPDAPGDTFPIGIPFVVAFLAASKRLAGGAHGQLRSRRIRRDHPAAARLPADHRAASAPGRARVLAAHAGRPHARPAGRFCRSQELTPRPRTSDHATERASLQCSSAGDAATASRAAASAAVDGSPVLQMAPPEVIRHGIGRTFQNLALFRSMTVLENVLVGDHIKMRRSGLLEASLPLPSALKAESASRARALEMLD